MIKKKLSISIYTSADFPYGGAAENFIRQLALGINENKAFVEVIRWKGNRKAIVNNTSIKCSNYLFSKPCKNEFLKFFELILLISFIPCSLIYKKLFYNNKYVLLYGLEYAYIVLPFIFWSRLFGIRCYRIVTDKYRTNTIVPVWWKKPKLFFYNIQSKHFDRYLHGLVVVSKFLYNISLKNNVNAHKIILIPHFIDVKANITFPKKPSNIKIIGFCGNPSIHNGIIDLVNAYALVSELFPESELHIIGKISEETLQLIHDLKIPKDKIVQSGYLSNNNIILKELLTCTVLVNPRQKSTWADAGFPTKLGEYFAVEKPIVTTMVGDISNYFINKKEVVFAEPNNPQSIADAIIYIFENIDEAETIANNGKKWACENLDYVKNASKLIDFLINS